MAERCEICELLIGEGCAGHGPETRGRRPLVDGGSRFAPDTILISPSGTAHIPGACGHLTESEVTEPDWGWITDPPAGLWDQLGEQLPAVATAGNTARVATKRCGSCAAFLAS